MLAAQYAASVSLRRRPKTLDSALRMTRLYASDIQSARRWRDGMGLHPIQFRQLDVALKQLAPNAQVIEFGSGASTRYFLDKISDKRQSQTLVSFDHSQTWAYSGVDPNLDLRIRHLVQWSDSDFSQLFIDGYSLDAARPVPETALSNMRLQNAFYAIDANELPTNPGLVLLDGPNGNGRGAAFPLLRGIAQPGCLIFIDDLTSYQFEEMFSSVFSFETIARLVDPTIHPTFSFGLYRIVA